VRFQISRCVFSCPRFCALACSSCVFSKLRKRCRRASAAPDACVCPPSARSVPLCYPDAIPPPFVRHLRTVRNLPSRQSLLTPPLPASVSTPAGVANVAGLCLLGLEAPRTPSSLCAVRTSRCLPLQVAHTPLQRRLESPACKALRNVSGITIAPPRGPRRQLLRARIDQQHHDATIMCGNTKLVIERR